MTIVQNPIFKELFQVQFAPILACVFLMIFICTNSLLDKKLNRLFVTAIVLAVGLLMADGVEYYCSSLSYPVKARVVASIIGYTLRPMILLCIIFMLLRGRRKRKLLYFIPCILVFLTSVTALFSNLAFSYNEANEFVRGPLGLVPHLVALLYMGVIILYAATRYKEKNNLENMFVVAIIIVNVFSVIVEMSIHYEGLLNISIMLSVTFYYLLLNAQAFKRDVLTGAFNRRSFYADVEQKKNQLTAVVSIDLNDLKVINDSQGHTEGDKAICAIATLVQENLKRGCFLYRTGGDEFVILVFRKYPEKELEHMLQKIRDKVHKAGYGCAMGLACGAEAGDYDTMLAEADQKMYQDKIRCKGSVR